MSITFTHDPQAVLDYDVDWSQWLQDGETITTATWTVPDGLEQPAGKPPTIDGGRTIVWIKGGTVGTTYTLTVHVVTSMGREDDRTIYLHVKER